MLAQVGTKLTPSWPQVGPCWPDLVQVGPIWPQVGSKMAPSRPMLTPSEPHDGPSSKVSPRLAKVATKALPLRPGFPKMSTKALPQAFRRLMARSGCSILLLSISHIVSSRHFSPRALSWQVFQNDLFKRSSQVVPVGGSFLKSHSFSCIVRRHSSKYMVKYIQQKQQQKQRRQQHKNLLWQFIQLSIPLPGVAKGLSSPPTP